MSVFLLKIVAVFCMVCDHIRYITPALDTELTRFFGRIAFPIFAFFIAEGYIHTKNIKKYIGRLVLFAFISEIPFLLFINGCNVNDSFELNVIFTMLFGFLAILSYDKIKNVFLKIISMLLLITLAQISNCDYGALGVIIILNFYILRDKKIIKSLILIILFIGELFIRCNMNINSIIYCIPYFGGYIFSAIILAFYNGEVGKFKLKYFFYFFYPVHMMIIYFIYNLVN